MSSKAKRVALLSRPGAAGERLAEVLGEAGIELVLQADPTQVDAATVLGVHPDTLLVALDVPTEDALERLEAALHAPTVDVIYEEAALVVAREGWDAARWRRHLLAKLQGHGNVLPPAQAVPVEAVRAPVADVVATDAVTPVAPPIVEAELALEPEVPAVQPAAEAPVAAAPAPFVASVEWTLDPGPVDAPQAAPATSCAVDPEVEAFAPSLLADATEPTVAAESAIADGGATSALDFNIFDPVAAELAEDSASPAFAESWGGQGFVPETEAATGAPDEHFNSDLASLELRIASMSLVDDAPGQGPAKVRGAVLVLAGIGGPDAVRQLLGSLPPDFVRPVLVQQRLDGARYDRLVAQMQRATTLPVKLAEAGQPVEQGTVYIVPDAIGVSDTDGALSFQDGANDILAALPAAESAVLMLSGSEPARVDAALSFGWNGGLVVGQNVDGCYDAAAVTDLAARGGTVAKPAEMGPRMVAHWQQGG